MINTTSQMQTIATAFSVNNEVVKPIKLNAYLANVSDRIANDEGLSIVEHVQAKINDKTFPPFY